MLTPPLYFRIPLCTAPSLENGYYESSQDGADHQQGEYIFAACLPGYRLQGTTIRRRCLGVDGRDHWSGQDPVCTRGRIFKCGGSLSEIFEHIKPSSGQPWVLVPLGG